MNTEETEEELEEDNPAPEDPSYDTEGRPLRPLAGVSLLSDLLVTEMCEGSSNCPAGVRRRPPSGLKVSLRKKLVKLSSP
jgi:hypothetical protein